jgi:hypothetical protein
MKTKLFHNMIDKDKTLVSEFKVYDSEISNMYYETQY